MPIYRLRYRVDTSLTCDEDVLLKNNQYQIKFLFSQRSREDNSVLAETDLEAANHNEATLIASGVAIPPVLDALCFAAGGPSLLRDCEVILKREPGSQSRRARYVGQRSTPNFTRLTPAVRESSQRILDTLDRPELPLYWYRYSQHRQLILDRFVFTWLAFEELAGDADVRALCSTCGAETTYRGANKERAWELFLASNKGSEQNEFRREIWGRARNAVFHGSKYPDPQFLSELNGYTARIALSVGHEIARQLDCKYQEPIPTEQIYRVFLFFEWETRTPEIDFADDWPAEQVKTLIEQAELGRWGFRTADRLRLLNYNEHSDW